MKKKVAFTLAELLIVLVAMGAIAMIIIPSVVKTRPDESLLKFKKGYYTMQRTVDAVLNSDSYASGDLSQNTPLPAGVAPFCHYFTQMLNTIDENCEFATNTTRVTYDTADPVNTANLLDTRCANLGEDANPVRFVTQDGISWGGFNYNYSVNTDVDSDGYRTDYGLVCFDVDTVGRDNGVPRGEAPFGFGIRNDGRIIVGTRAARMLEMDPSIIMR